MSSRRATVLSLTLVLTLVMVACRGKNGRSSSPVPTRDERTASPRAEPKLPEITSVKQAGGQATRVPASADWVLVAFGRAWVSDVGKGVGFYEMNTGRLEGSVAVPHSPCASMDSGFRAIWTATCEKRGIARIDPKTQELTDWIALDVPAEGESSIGVGEGGIWALTDGNDCSGCRLVRIDPATVKIANTYELPEGGTAVRAGLGGIWITYSSEDHVTHVDPTTGAIVADIDVGSGPRFLDVGEGGVWVMNQLDGSVSHIDPTSDSVVATIPVETEAIFGGDLTVGGGSVWLRGSSQMVAQIAPAADRVVARIGSARASGGAHASNRHLWVVDHFERPQGWRAVLYRIPLKNT